MFQAIFNSKFNDKFLKISALLCLGILCTSPSYSQVQVTTTIKPLQLIAQEIVQERGTVSALIGQYDSAHHFSLSPSDRIALDNADLLLWISPEFEIQLSALFGSQNNELPIITAASTPEILVLQSEDNRMDPHLWLNTSNAVVIAKELSAQLQIIDAANGLAYQHAFSRFESRMNEINATITQQLAGFADRDYLTYHDAYQYFEHEFNLKGGAVLVNNEDVQPSMRDLLAFRSNLQTLDPTCILVESDSDLALVNTALENRDIARERVDLLGYEIEDSSNGFQQLMLNTASTFNACFNKL